MITVTKNWIRICLLSLIAILLVPTLVQGVNSGIPSSQTETSEDAVQMNMWLVGSDSSNIEGGETAAGREGSIKVIGYHNLISAPYGSTNQYAPVKVVKYTDKASPILMKALCTRETLPEVTIKFYAQNTESGPYEWYYTIELSNARLIQIESQATTSGGFTETLSFEYQTITWIWEVDGISYSDSKSAV